MDIPQLKETLSDINRMGYIVSLRKRNTGIGYTLETLLGIAENNLRSPDLENIELRMETHRPPSRMGNFLGSQQNG